MAEPGVEGGAAGTPWAEVGVSRHGWAAGGGRVVPVQADRRTCVCSRGPGTALGPCGTQLQALTTRAPWTRWPGASRAPGRAQRKTRTRPKHAGTGLKSASHPQGCPVVRSITVNDSGTDYNPNETESGVCVHEPTNGRGGRGPSRWHWTPPCAPWSQPTQARNRNHANQCGRGKGRLPESVSRGGASLRRGLAGSASIAAPTGHGPCHRQVPPGEGAQEGHSTARALRGGWGGGPGQQS